jgi:serine/threonine-protein kinase
LAAVVLTAVTVGVAVWNLKPTEPQPVTARFYHELPDGQGFTRTGRPLVAISPDGSQIVYVANSQLYLRNLGEMAARPIQGTDEDPDNPFFSPDGEWVGYWSAWASQLKKIAPIGGAPVTLCDATNPLGASWGSDDTIVYGQPEGIMRVSANGGAPELVVPTEAPDQVHGPQMLPGGEWVLFTLTSASGATRWDEAQIVVQSLESGERRILWEGGSDARYVPTGHLIYALEEVLFAFPFDLASLEVSGGPIPIVEGVRRADTPTGNTASANYGFSDRGTLIYVPGSVGGSRILGLADRNGAVEALDVPPMAYGSPRLSPDGSRLAVDASSNEGSDIWVYDLAGDTQIRRLTLEGNNIRPIWTPDGERVTFASDREETPGIYWQLADGSGVPERLTTAEEGTQHWPESWSPDGETLAFTVSSGSEEAVWTLSRDSGTKPEVFVGEPGSPQRGSAFSPDGKWLAYVSRESGFFEVYVQPFPKTGAKHRITQQGGQTPLWSPDGNELVVVVL